LTCSLTQPATSKYPLSKNRVAIKEAVSALHQSLDGGETNFILLQNAVRQAYNFFFERDAFPKTYQEMQEIPFLRVDLLTYASDDSGKMRQNYCMALDNAEHPKQLFFRFRFQIRQGSGNGEKTIWSSIYRNWSNNA
jgi:hypothetical protein